LHNYKQKRICFGIPSNISYDQSIRGNLFMQLLLLDIDGNARSHGLTLALGGAKLRPRKLRDFNGKGCNKVVGAGSPSA
jgi:hypothetical protein